ncbi:outer membrane protein transport protein [bacterium]|nr:outer membrane protein transport protein [bacterium]
MRRLIVALTVSLLTGATWSVEPPDIRITSSPNPIGSGARATAMGGAFIAIADDSTASSWNPAGLAQLERPEMSIVGEGFFRLEDLFSDVHPESDGDSGIDLYRINFANASYPFVLFDRPMVVSLNYQRLYGFDRELSFDFNTGNALLSQEGEYEFEQEGDLYAFSPAFGMRLSDKLSVGATLNVWRDPLGRDYAWKSTVRYDGTGLVEETDAFGATIFMRDVYKDFSGENFNLGLRYELTPRIALGAVFKSPFTADVRHERKRSTSVDFGGGADPVLTGFSRKEEMDFPWVVGVGTAVQWTRSLKTSLDVTRTEWDDFVLEDDHGNRFSAVTGRRASEEDIDPTYTVRAGMEYLIFTERAIVPLRAGVFYDPEPSHRHPDDYAGVSVGSGYVSEALSLDFSYTWRFGRNVGGDVLDVPGARMDVDQHQLLVSIIKYF